MLHSIAQIDATLFMLINGHHNAFSDWFFLIVTQLGNGWVMVPMVGAIIFFLTPRTYRVKAMAFAAIAATVTGICNTQMKHAVHRLRPISYFEARAMPAAAANERTFAVHSVGEQFRHNSFPSGHSATVFSAAAILVALYGGWFYSAFAVALAVAYSRVYLGVHFPFDTAGGAFIGCGCVILVALVFRWRGYLAFFAKEKLW